MSLARIFSYERSAGRVTISHLSMDGHQGASVRQSVRASSDDFENSDFNLGQEPTCASCCGALPQGRKPTSHA
jgi:hypothetical protein